MGLGALIGVSAGSALHLIIVILLPSIFQEEPQEDNTEAREKAKRPAQQNKHFFLIRINLTIKQ